MAKREKTWWAIRAGDGILLNSDGTPYLETSCKRATDHCRDNKVKGWFPVRVKIVEVE